MKSSTIVSVKQKNMSYISSIPHGQLMLLCSIDGYVSSDHIVRFIDAFVDRVIRPIRRRPSVLPVGMSL